MDFKDYFDITKEFKKSISSSEDINNLILDKRIFPVDSFNCTISFSLGVGGKESENFCIEMLSFYEKIISNSGFKVNKQSAFSLYVKGDNAYKFLKYEMGVYRIQRVPQTEKKGRLHTSTISVLVIPDIPKEKYQLLSKDLRIDCFRAQGKGGQHVNKTDSAVRITHIPTGLQAVCQNERSQLNNKETAMKTLTERIAEFYENKFQDFICNFVYKNRTVANRNEKIRTFDFKGNRITDHRIKKSFNLNQILNKTKDINSFIKEIYLVLEKKNISSILPL